MRWDRVGKGGGKGRKLGGISRISYKLVLLNNIRISQIYYNFFNALIVFGSNRFSDGIKMRLSLAKCN
jgi:hypothetical protein